MNYGRVGYTVIEVMIFLAISGVLFITAVGVFSGRREGTQLTQTMQDLQSQFRAYANQVSTSYVPDTGGLNCSVGPISGRTARPVFTSGPSSDECILLGKAIQIVSGNDTMYSYPVFGLRTVYNGAVNTKVYPTSIVQAAPEPALDNSTPANWLGVEQYRLSGGFTFVHAKQSGILSNQDLLLLYSSLQNDNTNGNEIAAQSYRTNFITADIKGPKLKSCIENTIPSCLNPSRLNNAWKLCVTDGTKMAELFINSTSTGITTSLDMDGCP
jgi:type II secretory pathway pseudopilin PulG